MLRGSSVILCQGPRLNLLIIPLPLGTDQRNPAQSLIGVTWWPWVTDGRVLWTCPVGIHGRAGWHQLMLMRQDAHTILCF